MRRLNHQIRKTVEFLLGVDIEHVDTRSFVISGNELPNGVWCAKDTRLAKLLAQMKIDLVIDAGANVGQFGKKLRTKYSGEIMSFEPVSSCFSQLKAATATDLRWHAHKYALGSREEQANINVSQSSDFSSMLKTNDYCVERFGEKSKGNVLEAVQIVRLDTFLSGAVSNASERRIFLKMDTQGFDLEVFKGAEQVVERIFLLQAEVSLQPIYEGMPSWTEAIAQFERSGFRVAGLFPVNEDNNGCIIEYDCLMRRPE
jgi:FkbM family methyltransferase